MKFILGKKQKMSQFFDAGGKAYPATLIDAGPVTVLQIKTADKDKYNAAQVGYGETKESKINKSQRSKLGNFKYRKEFSNKDKTKPVDGLKEEDKISVDIFAEADTVTVAGISKGKGFQGVVKRHGFHGGPRTHGQRHSEREPGSIGSTGPQRVFKGMRMAGRMGADHVVVRNLKILKIDKDNNQMLISGAIPGRKGTLLEIYCNGN